MSSLQTVAMGLLIVVLDVGAGGWDWIPDPLGWVLVLMGLAPVKGLVPGHGLLVGFGWGCLVVSVLTFPAGSVDTIDESLGWLFSLPTVVFSVLLCGSLAQVAEPPSLATRFRWLRVGFVVVAALPVLVYGVGWDWLTVPTAVAAVLANVLLVLWVWTAGGQDAAPAPVARPTRQPEPSTPQPTPQEPGGRRRKDQGFDAEAVKRRVRRARGE